MNRPPGQGKSGQYLMNLWGRYLEQYAELEGRPEEQIVVGSYHAAEALGFLSSALDRDRRYCELIGRRMALFAEGCRAATLFADRLITATFTIYNHVNTLCHEFTDGIAEARNLVGEIDERVRSVVEQADPIERSAAAMRAAFPLLCLITMVLDKNGGATAAIRTVEERFARGAGRASSSWEQLLNALYRAVEIMQVLISLSEPDLKDQVSEIALRFEEEDRTRNLRLKLRNGFCRLFELSHLLANQVDEMLSQAGSA